MKSSNAVTEAFLSLQKAVSMKKCWSCGCFHGFLQMVDEALPATIRPGKLDTAIAAATERLTEVRQECLGCEVCFPANAVNALLLEEILNSCNAVEQCPGWPPLPGRYKALRYCAPVAVCTLTDEGLCEEIAAVKEPAVSIVGMLHTENLGIELLITNTAVNPNIRFLIICGSDSQGNVGHLPGQSLVALAREGIDERSRIIGALGKRPILRNVPSQAVEHFRRTVEVVDLIGTEDVRTIIETVRQCAAHNPGPTKALDPMHVLVPIQGYSPDRLIRDPTGYFVVYADLEKQLLFLEHYQNDYVLDAVIEGRTAAELYTPAIEQGLISRLDHAAYLGQELARAEAALRRNEPYNQDVAPAWSPRSTSTDCGCDRC